VITVEMPRSQQSLDLSQDAAIVLALARTSLPFAGTSEEEAERWLRVLRMHGQVGCALQALGVGEAPLEAPAEPKARRKRNRPFTDVVEEATSRAFAFARRRGARAVGTVDILFAVLYLYGSAFDRELYRRGTTRDELLERLPAYPALAAVE
jgi:hypothetical protein